jgi:hypothetical protein
VSSQILGRDRARPSIRRQSRENKHRATERSIHRLNIERPFGSAQDKLCARSTDRHPSFGWGKLPDETHACDNVSFPNKARHVSAFFVTTGNYITGRFSPESIRGRRSGYAIALMPKTPWRITSLFAVPLFVVCWPIVHGRSGGLPEIPVF